jgi:PAS domain S-box-containing protein
VRQSKWFARVRTQFETIFREGADATAPHTILEFLASVVGVGLLSLNTLIALAMLPWSSQRREGHKRREGSSDPIWVKLDSDFRYVDMSPEFCEFLGFSRSQLIGRSAEYVTPDDFANIEVVRDEIRRGRRKKGFWIYRRSDGKLVLVQYEIRVRPDNMADLIIAPVDLSYRR